MFLALWEVGVKGGAAVRGTLADWEGSDRVGYFLNAANRCGRGPGKGSIVVGEWSMLVTRSFPTRAIAGSRARSRVSENVRCHHDGCDERGRGRR